MACTLLSASAATSAWFLMLLLLLLLLMLLPLPLRVGAAPPLLLFDAPDGGRFPTDPGLLPTPTEGRDPGLSPPELCSAPRLLPSLEAPAVAPDDGGDETISTAIPPGKQATGL